jgi:hypothetical protein
MGMGMTITSFIIIATANITIITLKHLNDRTKAVIEIVAQVCFLAMLLYWVYIMM